ncbi:6-bladed beta-propeller [Fodinibius salsisoli]|uniref:6-bladed beta-propeller n=1 Tax=Fodinibius salsisoli TaxID=2820877 RepID=A0ABT3PQR0_9BACT|nr:6-bladed beta-propeller [Fodinibius salsisoli]MCW9708193.1 6-bladed beta-propeller [Fodinibius salsisoli]
MYSNIRLEMIFAVACMLIGIFGCQGMPDSSSDIEIVELKDYDTIASYEEGTLINPAILRYDGDSLLYVYDVKKKQVLALDQNGQFIREFGGQGRGPGEFLLVNNFYLNNDYLYIVDQLQFRIASFTLDGELDATLDYGQKGSQSMPPPAPQSLIPRPKDIANQPFVTSSGQVMVSAIAPGEDFNKLYTLVDWQGNQKAEIGDIPDGSTFVLDYEQYQATVDEGEVPAYYRPNVFPVNDRSNHNEFYFIYTAFPKIVKYHTSGEKTWEQDVPNTAEMDSIFTHFYEVSADMSGKNRIGLDTYLSGVTNEDGDLYLVVGKNGMMDSSNDLWIHEFTNEGELNQRIRLVSEEVNLVPIFDIDFNSQRIFVVTEEAEIRAYEF